MPDFHEASTAFFHGYPDRVRRDLLARDRDETRSMRGCFIVIVFLFFIFSYVTLGAWRWISIHHKVSRYDLASNWGVFGLGLAISVLLGFLICLFISGYVNRFRLRYSRPKPSVEERWPPSPNWRVVPCFDQPLRCNWKNASSEGTCIARSAERLDALAKEMGIASLTGLGLDDDLPGKSFTWHDPRDGIITCEKLMQGIEKMTPQMEEAPKLLEELNAIVAVLKIAETQACSFCLCVLLFRHQYSTPSSIGGHNIYFG